jgi:UDP-N-acetylglucosamine 2-epimerase (non-hydrolysing)
MEAGNRCFDQNVPEEINRRIVDHTADVNLAYTEHSRRHLLAEGRPAEYTFVTGSPMREVLEQNREGIEASAVLAEQGLAEGGYIVLSAHREENVDHEGRFAALMGAVNAVADRYGLPVVFSTHPRSRKRMEERGFAFHPLVRTLRPFGFHDYVHLQQHAFCVLSDSGTLSEESAVLRFPAVLLRTSTERPEAVDKGGVVLGGITQDTVLPAVALATDPQARPAPGVPDYADADVSSKVVRIIQGYTDLVNRNVWRKGQV